MTTQVETEILSEVDRQGIFELAANLDFHRRTLEAAEDSVIINQDFNPRTVVELGINIAALIGGYHYFQSEIARIQGDTKGHQKEAILAKLMKDVILAGGANNYHPLGLQLKRLGEGDLFTASVAQAVGQHYSPTLGLKYLEMAEVLLYLVD